MARGETSRFGALEELLAMCAARGQVPVKSGRRTYEGRAVASPPATAEQIASTEAALGHALAPEHRALLARWNGASFFARVDGGVASATPALFGTEELVERCDEAGFRDERLLLVGKLDDEAFLYLDRRHPEAEAWPVRWADECDPAEEILEREPLGASIDEFLRRFAESRGEWYWVAEPPRAWMRDETVRYELWRHGLGLFLMPCDHPEPCWRIGILGTPAVVPETALIVAGLTRELVAHGGAPVAPSQLRLGGYDRYFRFPSRDRRPALDPREIPPAEPPADGWREVAPDLHVHGPARAALYRARQSEGSHELTVSWAEGGGEPVAEPLLASLRAAGLADRPLDRIPDGYEATSFRWGGKPAELPLPFTSTSA